MLSTCEQALRVRNVLDDWLQARIRDSKVVMYPLLRLVFGRRFRVFADFKQQGFWLSADQFSDVYGSTAGPRRAGRGLRHRARPGAYDRDGVRLVEGSVEDLPFPDDAFDTVVSTHTLEHVQRIGVALSELRTWPVQCRGFRWWISVTGSTSRPSTSVVDETEAMGAEQHATRRVRRA